MRNAPGIVQMRQIAQPFPNLPLVVVESVKGGHHQLDHELACGQAVEFELLLDAYGEILKDFQLGSDVMSLCFIKVTLAAVQNVYLRMAINLENRI